MYRNRDTVRVSHIGSSENQDAFTQVGTVLINFLVGMKVDPNANVALIVDDGRGRVLVSLYDFDLFEPISALPGSPDIILTSVNFEDPFNKRDSLEKLVEYLQGISNKSYDDTNIYEKAMRELTEIPVFKEKIVTTELRGQRNHLVAPVSTRTFQVQTQRQVPVPVPGQVRSGFDNNPQSYTPADTRRGGSTSEVIEEQVYYTQSPPVTRRGRGRGY